MKTLLALLTLGLIACVQPASAEARDRDHRDHRDGNRGREWSRSSFHHQRYFYRDAHHRFAGPRWDRRGHRVDSRGHHVDRHGHHTGGRRCW